MRGQSRTAWARPTAAPEQRPWIARSPRPVPKSTDSVPAASPVARPPAVATVQARSRRRSARRAQPWTSPRTPPVTSPPARADGVLTTGPTRRRAARPPSGKPANEIIHRATILAVDDLVVARRPVLLVMGDMAVLPGDGRSWVVTGLGRRSTRPAGDRDGRRDGREPG